MPEVEVARAGHDKIFERDPASQRVWENNIVGYDEVDPHDLIPNPKNWRVHPDVQRLALIGALDEVGWLQPVTWNRRTNHLLDGHLRRDIAIVREESTVPRCIVDISLEQEMKALATIDPLAGLAETDNELLAELLNTLDTENDALGNLFFDMMPAEYSATGGATEPDGEAQLGDLEFRIVIECQNEVQQAILLERFEEEGLMCKALIS